MVFSRSPGMAYEVTATMGMFFNDGFIRSRRATAYPSMRGQLDVEQDQVRLDPVRQSDALRSVGRRDDFIAVFSRAGTWRGSGFVRCLR